MKTEFTVYAAGSLDGAGVSRFILKDSRLIPDGVIKCPGRVMYFVEDGGDLHISARGKMSPEGDGIYIKAEPDGRGGYSVSEEKKIDGVCACHISVSGDDVYTVGYSSGTVTHLGDKTVTHEPKLHMRPGRQDRPHTHEAVISPCGNYLLVTDLGLDRIYVYDRALNGLSVCMTEPGQGVRHLVFSPDGKHVYAANELASTVSVFSWEPGRLTLLHTVEPGFIEPDNYAAAIRTNAAGTKLYVSQRGKDVIGVFEISSDGEELKLIGNFGCGGRFPRDFYISPDERFIAVANERSGNLSLLEMKDGIPGRILDNASLPAALCVLIK